MVCNGRRAREAAVYHFKLCRAILVGFRAQLQADGKVMDGNVGMIDEEMIEIPLLHVGMTEADVKTIQPEDVFVDAMTGQYLNPDLVRAARKRNLSTLP